MRPNTGRDENTHMAVDIHHANFDDPRQQVIVLAGAPSLRAHQIVNRTADAIRFLAFSTSGEPDVVLQLDSGKIGAFERRPDGGGRRVWFRREDEVDYYEGESVPG